jgi:hypothetical protein
LDDTPTIFVDLLAKTVSLLDFAPMSETSKLLCFLSVNIPAKLQDNAIGFISCLEDICTKVPDHECLENFFVRFPKAPSKMMIFTPLSDRQFANRTIRMELSRIARTNRVNEDSINFLLQMWMRSNSFENVDSLTSGTKRAVLNTIHDFAIRYPRTLGLFLYSQLYERFFDIHPSPNIISCDTQYFDRLFKSAIDHARHPNPSISRTALTALSSVVIGQKIPADLPESLSKELFQYADWTRPAKNRRKPPEDAPWISQTVCKL